ncbi:Abhydrolase domain-containing protein 2 [Hypsibius exemplaris]|uniref:Abhydrolase domain-containing protein 2 n=1 Tax=Hypsibius exemplaris TaxID=2072580 RepID=A0A1W0XB50_HYPEX|nr:Abhydrolase domain-containing protein 2 [Hypsibius exemplaris]
MYLEILLVSTATLIWWFRSLLREENGPKLPQLIFKEESRFTKEILDKVTILQEKYVTPLLWGRNGQWQTLAYGILGHRKSSRWRAKGYRETFQCMDGATISFDVFEPIVKHSSGADLTFLICPGIANSCESVYIRSFVQNAQNCGFRCYVLNHLGVVASVKLTSARLFSYGGTAEFAAMVDCALRQHPSSRAIALGFSMGGNVITCWLGESKEHQKKVLCAISVCQGYDIIRSRPVLLQWAGLRRAYMFSMARNMKRILARNRDILFSPEVLTRHPEIDIKAVFGATTLLEIDEYYTRVLKGYSSVDEMYVAESSAHKLREIHIPIMFVNALDDPIVPEELLDCVKDYASTHDNAIAVITQHGGHLGFFEGDSYLIPKPVSWLCRLVIQYTESVLTNEPQRSDKLANGHAAPMHRGDGAAPMHRGDCAAPMHRGDGDGPAVRSAKLLFTSPAAGRNFSDTPENPLD